MFVPMLLAALCVLRTTVDAQIPFLGPCPDKDVVKDFNITRYLGKWYEQQRYFAIFQLGGNCVTATYTDEGDDTVGIENTHVNLITNRKTTIKGKARLAGAGDEGKLNVTFQSFEFAWVLTRAKVPTLEDSSHIRDVLEENSLEVMPFRRTLQVCEDN